jgi:hypothetical protein
MTVEFKYEHFLVCAIGLEGAEAKRYVAQVVGMLRALDSFRTGRALQTFFRAAPQWTMVQPYDGRRGPCNALGGGKNDGGSIGSNVWFTPLTFAKAPCASSGGGGNTPMEILMHELVHAVRGITGNWLKGSVTIGDEELIAVMITNILSSELNRPLRSAYGGFPTVAGSIGDYQKSYYQSRLPLIETVHKQNPSLARVLARLDVPFNPIRMYYQRTQPGVW